MSHHRIIKQILYCLLYLAILIVIGFLVFLLAMKPKPTCFDGRRNQGEIEVDCGGPCPPCEIKYLKPLEAQKIRFFESQNKTIVVAEILNPNQEFGADQFRYLIDFYNSEGKKIDSFVNNSFIYPAEIKAIFEINDKIKFNDVSRITINFSEVHWVSKEDFQKPVIEVQNQTLIVEKPLKLSGVVTNKSNFEVRVKLIAFIFNRYGIQLGASKTEIENLAPHSLKDFQLTLPPEILEEEIDQSQTKIFIEAKRY